MVRKKIKTNIIVILLLTHQFCLAQNTPVYSEVQSAVSSDIQHKDFGDIQQSVNDFMKPFYTGGTSAEKATGLTSLIYLIKAIISDPSYSTLPPTSPLLPALAQALPFVINNSPADSTDQINFTTELTALDKKFPLAFKYALSTLSPSNLGPNASGLVSISSPKPAQEDMTPSSAIQSTGITPPLKNVQISGSINKPSTSVESVAPTHPLEEVQTSGAANPPVEKRSGGAPSF